MCLEPHTTWTTAGESAEPCVSSWDESSCVIVRSSGLCFASLPHTSLFDLSLWSPLKRPTSCVDWLAGWSQPHHWAVKQLWKGLLQLCCPEHPCCLLFRVLRLIREVRDFSILEILSVASSVNHFISSVSQLPPFILSLAFRGTAFRAGQFCVLGKAHCVRFVWIFCSIGWTSLLESEQLLIHTSLIFPIGLEMLL